MNIVVVVVVVVVEDHDVAAVQECVEIRRAAATADLEEHRRMLHHLKKAVHTVETETQATQVQVDCSTVHTAIAQTQTQTQQSHNCAAREQAASALVVAEDLATAAAEGAEMLLEGLQRVIRKTARLQHQVWKRMEG
jgi:hypothetical protein